METSHPKPAPSASYAEKILSGIDYPATKGDAVRYARQKILTSENKDP